MKRNKSVFFGGLVVALFSFAFIFLVSDFGSADACNTMDDGCYKMYTNHVTSNCGASNQNECLSERCPNGYSEDSGWKLLNNGDRHHSFKCTTNYCCVYTCKEKPKDAKCDSASDITCGTTQERSGTCGGNGCKVTGTKCSSGYTCKNSKCEKNCSPVPGGWSATSNGNYSVCSIDGQKTRTLTQTCNNPSPSCGGSNCSTTKGWTRSGNSQTKIETSTDGCPKLNTAYWANLLGVPIENASKGDTVLMISGGENLQGKTINYTVQEFNSSAVWWNPFSWFSKNWNSANKVSGNAVEPWILGMNSDTKRFVANVTGTSISNISRNLTIISEGTNSRPIVNITAPIRPEGDLFLNYSVGQDINFRQISTDKDDLLKIVWDFGDGNNSTIYNYSRYLNSSKGDVVHSYSKGNQFYTVKLTASEMSRSQKDESSLELFVFEEGINVVPIISAPLEGVVGYRVLFNASKSYVVNCSEDLESYIFTVDKLKCKYILAPGSLEPEEGYNVSVRWKEVQEGGRWIRGGEDEWVDWNEENYGYHGDNRTNLNGAVVFEQIYELPASRMVVLEIGVEVA